MGSLETEEEILAGNVEFKFKNHVCLCERENERDIEGMYFIHKSG